MPKRAVRPLLFFSGLIVLLAAWLTVAHPLSGQVVDAETGQPLAGIPLRVAGQSVVTDEQGRFGLHGLRGIPTVEVDEPGYQPLRSALLLGDLARLDRSLTIRLQPVELYGVVRDGASGEPLAGATVSVGEQVLTADAQGRYAVLRILPGTAIRAAAPHYAESDVLTYNGQAVQDIPLTLLPATVRVRDLCTGRLLPEAAVTAGAQQARPDAQGSFSFTPQTVETEVQAELDGYDLATGVVHAGEELVLDLPPRAVCGVVRDERGEPVEGALVLARADGREPQLAYSDEDGAYRLEGVPVGSELIVRRGGYRRAEQVLADVPCTDLTLEPFAVRGIYLAFHMLTPAYQAQLQANLDLVERSDLNAVVIELKTETGYLGFQPQWPLAREIGAGTSDTVDVRALLADCRRRGIYTIARMPVFEDDLLATMRPEWAVHYPDGSVWRAAGGRAWVDPFRREVWEYNVALAKEAIALGFDEVQFDYVRFPSDGAVLDCRYIRESTAESRVEAVTSFLAYAREELDPTGAFLSADLFGLTTFDPEEKGIGQLMERVGPYVDYVSPMVYPSTYLRGMLDLDDPWRQPYEVVKLSLLEARKKTSTPIRPWLQHFDDYHGLGITYGLREIQLQQQGAQDGGACGWLFWNILGEYYPEAFGAESREDS